MSRGWLSTSLLAGMAALFGVVVARQSGLAVAITALVIVTLLAFLAPVTHLSILLALTAIVPYSIANRYSPGGTGPDSAGLLAPDLFLLTGLLRVAFVLPHLRLDRRRLTVVGLVVLSLAFTCFAAVQGLRAGHAVSNVGAEFRALGGGFAAALIAMTALENPGAHRRIMRALLVLGLALGAWGIAQWVVQLDFTGDFGVRRGVALTTSGRGQVQGGLFGFPVAVIVASAALASGRVRGLDRGLVLLVLGLNAVSLLLTFQRTFWLVTVLGVLLVALRSGRAQRARALLWIAVLAASGLLTLSAIAPGTLRTAEERLLSIGTYQTDKSLRYRTVESRFVIDKIHERPLLGWGLGDTIHWGQPWTSTPPAEQTYSHVGYLWLFWREGILGGGVLLALLILAALWPGRAAAGGLVSGVRTGCQASLIALLIVNLTFPTFQGTQITYVMGFLVAYCAIPVVAARRMPAAGHPAMVGDRTRSPTLAAGSGTS
jgi:O-antigen ligase